MESIQILISYSDLNSLISLQHARLPRCGALVRSPVGTSFLCLSQSRLTHGHLGCKLRGRVNTRRSKIKVNPTIGREGPRGKLVQGSTYSQPRHQEDVGWLHLRSAVFTNGKAPVFILEQAECIPAPVCTRKSEEKSAPLRHPGSNPGRPARHQAPCRLSYLARRRIFNETFNRNVTMLNENVSDCWYVINHRCHVSEIEWPLLELRIIKIFSVHWSWNLFQTGHTGHTHQVSTVLDTAMSKLNSSQLIAIYQFQAFNSCST